jgi:RNA polymerase sigma-70 factor, ECF subfamily
MEIARSLKEAAANKMSRDLGQCSATKAEKRNTASIDRRAAEEGGQQPLPWKEFVMEAISLIGNSTSCAAEPATVYEDMVLVHACKDGDVAAFEQLVNRYDARLFSIVQHIIHNREDAEDAVQETFLKAFRKLTQFRENSQFSTWLIRITVNESLMQLRKRRSIREVSMDEDFQSEEHISPFEFADWSPNPEELYRGSELRDILRSALQELQPSIRVVFVLRDVEGLSIEQAAEVLELTQAAIKARLWRARLQLRKRLSKYLRVRVTYSNPAAESAAGQQPTT